MTGPLILDEGIWPDIPEAIYHADPLPLPSLSSSVCKEIVDRSPAHAKQMHVRLTPQEPPKPSPDRDLGSAIHALTFGGAAVSVFEADDWRTKAAQEHRKECYASGRIPLLPDQLERAQAVAAIVRPRISRLVGDDYLPEVTLAWRDRGAWCRTRVDALSRDLAHVVDLKTSGAGTSPQEVTRRFFSESHDIQSGFISRGLDALDKPGTGRRTFHFVYVENEAPFGCTVLDIPESVMSFARRKVRVGIDLWRRSMASDDWPGYPAASVIAEMPAWAEQSWMTREQNDSTIKAIIAEFGAAVK